MTNPITPQQTADDLDAAADDLDQHGWCQGTMYTTDGRACVRGALYRTTQSLGRTVAAEHAILDMIETDDVVWGCIPDWNDTAGQTIDDVTGVMRKAAGHLRSPEEPS